MDVLLSIDVEEDNWASARERISVENVREIPAFAVFLERLGIRPTYFVNYQVAIRPWAIEILREVTEGDRAEIGAHLHPWNTPPAGPWRSPGDTMLCNYPADQQAAKIGRVTHALEDAFGVQPKTFRAGRFGLGPETVSALIAHGYHTDSSVTPYMSWARYDNGPNFQGAPLRPYLLDGAGDVRRPVPGGPLAEVPVSCGLSLSAVRQWDKLTRLLRAPPIRAMRIPSLLGRSGLLRRFVLSPETTSSRDMLAAGRRILAADVPLIHIFMHATSLRPGLSPFVRSRRDALRLYDRIALLVEGLARMASIQFRTVGEVGLAAHAPGSEVPRVLKIDSARYDRVSVPKLRQRSPRLLLVTDGWSSRAGTSGLPWTELAQELTCRAWEVHVAALDLHDFTLADGVLIHGLRLPARSPQRHAGARIRDLVARFDPDVIVTTGSPPSVHLDGHRARGSRPIAHILDLSAPPWVTADHETRARRLEAAIDRWFQRAKKDSRIAIVTGTNALAGEIRRRFPQAGVVEPVLESADPCGKLDEVLRDATR